MNSLLNHARQTSLAAGLFLALNAGAIDQPSNPPEAGGFQRANLEAFLENHCYECHDDLTAEGDLDLYSVGGDLSDPDVFLRWSQIFERVEKGEMPPKKKARPEQEEMVAFLSHLEVGLTGVELGLRNQYGRAELRRLSREEYANSLKDILDLPHVDFAEKLPPDGIDGHHRKSAAALDFSHVTISKYLEVADYALREALAPRINRSPKRVVRAEVNGADQLKKIVQTLYVQAKQGTAIPLNGREIDTTVTNVRGNFNKRDPGTYIDHPPLADGIVTFINNQFNHNIRMTAFDVQQTGSYKIRVHGWGTFNDHGKLLPSDRVETVAFYDTAGNVLGRCDLQPNEPNTGEATVWLKEGEPIQYLAISTPNRVVNIAKAHGEKYKHIKSYGIAIRWFELEGPLEKQWPPESHQRLLGGLKLKKSDPQPNGLPYVVKSENPKEDLRLLIGQFAERAFRRPLEKGDIDLAVQTADARIEAKESFIEALLAGYRTILTSPEFLLREEKPGQLDAWALATRLSFFLTNSPPDQGLRNAAADGSLLKKDELRRHTNRLLNSDASSRFVTHFCDYWLNLRNINLTEPDENIYPEYSGLVSESMVDETRAYFAEMIRENLGAMHVVDSDFVMINQRLADLYNIPGVQGSHIQKVNLSDDSVRGGLITQGSILKLTSNGTTTSPVVRGTYTLEHLFGDPPPPPPASVPAIEPDVTGASTIREQLEKHRAAEECASCHAKIDPPGFALESFDVMGQWRDNYRVSIERGQKGVDLSFGGKRVQYKMGANVDSAGVLPNGTTFSGIHEFRDALESYEQRIAHNLLEHLTIYATGAPLGFADRDEARQIFKGIEMEGYPVRSMIHALIQSELFRNK